MIKRWNLTAEQTSEWYDDGLSVSAHLAESEDSHYGEWVKWEDVRTLVDGLALLADKDAKLERIERATGESGWAVSWVDDRRSVYRTGRTPEEALKAAISRPGWRA